MFGSRRYTSPVLSNSATSVFCDHLNVHLNLWNVKTHLSVGMFYSSFETWFLPKSLDLRHCFALQTVQKSIPNLILSSGTWDIARQVGFWSSVSFHPNGPPLSATANLLFKNLPDMPARAVSSVGCSVRALSSRSRSTAQHRRTESSIHAAF